MCRRKIPLTYKGHSVIDDLWLFTLVLHLLRFISQRRWDSGLNQLDLCESQKENLFPYFYFLEPFCLKWDFWKALPCGGLRCHVAGYGRLWSVKRHSGQIDIWVLSNDLLDFPGRFQAPKMLRHSDDAFRHDHRHSFSNCGFLVTPLCQPGANIKGTCIYKCIYI